jgi:hypothetical protein
VAGGLLLRILPLNNQPSKLVRRADLPALLAIARRSLKAALAAFVVIKEPAYPAASV